METELSAALLAAELASQRDGWRFVDLTHDRLRLLWKNDETGEAIEVGSTSEAREYFLDRYRPRVVAAAVRSDISGYPLVFSTTRSLFAFLERCHTASQIPVSQVQPMWIAQAEQFWMDRPEAAIYPYC